MFLTSFMFRRYAERVVKNLINFSIHSLIKKISFKIYSLIFVGMCMHNAIVHIFFSLRTAYLWSCTRLLLYCQYYNVFLCVVFLHDVDVHEFSQMSLHSTLNILPSSSFWTRFFPVCKFLSCSL